MATRVVATVCSAALIHSVSNGFGRHFSQLDHDTMIAFQKDFYVALLMYIISTTLVKMCFLAQYLRIFEVGTTARTVCWICLVISGLWGAAFFVVGAAPCVPLGAFFDWTIEAHCYGYGSRNYDELFATFVAHSSINSLLDLIVLAIPLVMYLQKKTTSWKQRASIASLFSFGLLIFGISIWRLGSIIEHRAATWPVMDPTWYACSAIVLAVVEVDMASMCASIPVFWPVLQEGWGRIFVTHEIEVVHESRISGETQYGDFVRDSKSLHTRQGSNSSAKFVDIAKMVQQPRAAHHGNQSMPCHASRRVIRPVGNDWDTHTLYKPCVNRKEQQGVFRPKQGYEHFNVAIRSDSDIV
ncbi:hypothetical protein MN608_05997 [Microdochium nivale]|nr:hypothetical protein MN608_05997 [Microdochium nivale]